MKVAIPSNDGKIISPHFGRSMGFKIFEIEGDKIISENYMPNDFTGHAQGHHEHNREHHNHSHHGHSHQGIFNALEGVSAVIAGGMGRMLYDEFAQRNVKVFVTQEASVNTAVQRFIENNLDNSPDICCSH